MASVHAVAEQVHGDKKDEKYEEEQIFSEPIHGITSLYALIILISNCSKTQANQRPSNFFNIFRNLFADKKSHHWTCGATAPCPVVFDTAYLIQRI